jgi:hypothetical protein
MNNIGCKHITHDEIERYIKTDENCIFQDDLTFFEGFDNRLDNCDICAERFRVYNFISAMIDEELHKENFLAEAVKQFKDYLRQKIEEIGEIMGSFLEGLEIIPWPEPVMARDLQDENQTVTFDVKENGEFCQFNISKQTKVRIIMPKDLDSSQKYTLFLWRIADRESISYPLRETMQGGMAVETDELHEGEYLAAVVRLNKDA